MNADSREHSRSQKALSTSVSADSRDHGTWLSGIQMAAASIRAIHLRKSEWEQETSVRSTRAPGPKLTYCRYALKARYQNDGDRESTNSIDRQISHWRRRSFSSRVLSHDVGVQRRKHGVKFAQPPDQIITSEDGPATQGISGAAGGHFSSKVRLQARASSGQAGLGCEKNSGGSGGTGKANGMRAS